MYIPSSYAEHDLPTLHAYLEAHPLGAIVTNSEATGLYATHLPLLLDRSAGAMGTLFGHLARANPHSKLLTETPTPTLVIFAGPDAYITPNWYQTKQETAKVVPTWNYAAVHAFGAVRLREDPEFLREHLEQLTTRHESKHEHPWKVSDAPNDFIEQQMKAIVGVEVTIERLEGKWKMSQNRSAADVDGVIRGLNVSSSAQDHAVAGIVAEGRPKA
jgi:transcriptional regulator